MTIRSMTGFGRAEGTSAGLSFNVEVRSVNHRYLDIKTRLPKYLLAIESKLKGLIKPFAKRGRVDIQVALAVQAGSEEVYRLDVQAAQNHLSQHRELSDSLGIELQCSTRDLLKAPGVLTAVNSMTTVELEPEAVIEALEAAFTRLHDMRSVEGTHLRDAMLDILEKAGEHRAAIVSLAADQARMHREKLESRLGDLLTGTSSEQEARIMLEVGLIAERLDVQEELDRLAAHFEQFHSICVDETSEPVGRRLDFLCQEMVREINTIASKAQSIEVTRITIELKTLMERIREQVQNVE